jgi:sugar phosphate isomerase/epimerase
MPAPAAALQMFSVRDEARADYAGTLERVAEAGYTAIEAAFGFGGLSPAQLRPRLDELGIRVIASHVGSERLRTALEEEVETNLALGNRNLVCAELPASDRVDEEAFHRWAATLGQIGRRCRELGARLSYHSHAFEFRRFGAERGLEILLGEAGADALDWEPDVYWITFAGEDPAEWIGRYADRVRLVHLKDMKPEPRPADPIAANALDLKAHLATEVGEGIIDFAPAIAAARRAEWLIVEQDFAARPIFESVALSRRRLVEWGFGARR